MAIRSALFLLWLTLSAASVWTQEGPNRPEPKPLTLEGKSTAILVLDLFARCDDPKQVCSKISQGRGDFGADLLGIIAAGVEVEHQYGGALALEGQRFRLGPVWTFLRPSAHRRQCEPKQEQSESDCHVRTLLSLQRLFPASSRSLGSRWIYC